MKNTAIYAIVDTLAESIIGGLHMFKHDAAAVRFFSDVASQPDTIIAKHLNDHQLVCLGTLDESTCQLTVTDITHPRVVLTGSAWFLSRAEEPIK